MDRAEARKRARLARQEHVLAWHGSGLRQAAYCRQHNINATTFSGWLRDARAGDRRDGQPGAFQEKQAPLTALAVIISPQADSRATTAARHGAPERAGVTVTGAGGWQITIDSGSSAATTIKTLAALLIEIDRVNTNVSPRR